MRHRFLLWGFKTSQEIFDNSLGPLERGVLALAWDRSEISVREACAQLGSTVAYTTVMTTLDRLFKKGLLTRRKVGRAFVYQAAASRDEIERALVSDLFGSLLPPNGGEPLPVLSSLIDAVSDYDHALLEDLERLIHEKAACARRRNAEVTHTFFGVVLALTWFLLVNVVLSLLVAAVAGRVVSAIALRTPVARGRVLLALRLSPSVASAAFVAGAFLPSFWRLEPRDFDEAFGVTTVSCAVLAGVLIVTAVGQGVRAWQHAARNAGVLSKGATPLALPGAPVPVLAVDAHQAAMTLVGVGRARLLITRPLLAALTSEELGAALRHEYSHLSARDNLKRLAMRCAPDLLSIIGRHRDLERQWALAAEHAADQDAAGADPRVRLALASALVKAARLSALPAFSVGLTSPLIGVDAIASRVAQLVDPAANRPQRPLPDIISWTLAVSVLALGVYLYAPFLAQVHEATEAVVRFLP